MKRRGNKKVSRDERKAHLVPPLPNHLDGLKSLSQDLDVKVSLGAKVSVVGSRDREVLPDHVLLLKRQCSLWKCFTFPFSSLSESELELDLDLDRDRDFDLKQKLANLDVTSTYLKYIFNEICMFLCLERERGILPSFCEVFLGTTWNCSTEDFILSYASTSTPHISVSLGDSFKLA